MLAAGCGTAAISEAPPPAAPHEPPWFADVTAASGIDFVHDAGPSDGRYFMPQINGSGAALLDYNNDGRLDLYFANGARQQFHQQRFQPGDGSLRRRHAFLPAFAVQRPNHLAAAVKDRRCHHGLDADQAVEVDRGQVARILAFCELDDRDPGIWQVLEAKFDGKLAGARRDGIGADERRRLAFWIEPTARWLGYDCDWGEGAS